MMRSVPLWVSSSKTSFTPFSTWRNSANLNVCWTFGNTFAWGSLACSRDKVQPERAGGFDSKLGVGEGLYPWPARRGENRRGGGQGYRVISERVRANVKTVSSRTRTRQGTA